MQAQVNLKKNSSQRTLFVRKHRFKKSIFLLLVFLLVIPRGLCAKAEVPAKILILYYSRTGKTRLVCETLKRQLNTDMIEIKDPKDRSGFVGFVSSAIDAYLDRHTAIEPERSDISPYPFLIIASPVWSWKLSTPIHTLFEKNRFDGKKLVLITTANIPIMKYEKYGDDASFVKRFLRDYLRDKRKAAISEAIASGGDFVGHYHIATKGKSECAIKEEALACADRIKEKLFLNSSK